MGYMTQDVGLGLQVGGNGLWGSLNTGYRIHSQTVTEDRSLGNGIYSPRYTTTGYRNTLHPVVSRVLS